ncbi:hypothetical protein BC832DRAFT_270857 [Gaertneriomyces semiglobifer]|nr:hypothetical protein BC832DRAFT_270857 [Gaertneriomyces semiglobifer]
MRCPSMMFGFWVIRITFCYRIGFTVTGQVTFLHNGCPNGQKLEKESFNYEGRVLNGFSSTKQDCHARPGVSRLHQIGCMAIDLQLCMVLKTRVHDSQHHS